MNTPSRPSPGRWPGLVVIALLACLSLAHATLTPLDGFPLTGRYSLSVDGGGAVSTTYAVQVRKPSANATVHSAYLLAASLNSYVLGDSAVTLNGNTVTWADRQAFNAVGSTANFMHNRVANVTAIVKPIMDAAEGPGLTDFTVAEASSGNVDGTILAVVFNDPALATDHTVILLFGALAPGGDNFAITLAEPIPAEGVADMGLGISYSAQPDQDSYITVNGTRLTSAAGGADDAVGSAANGALLTVGGIGDSTANPTNPSAPSAHNRSDDELYSLIPLLYPAAPLAAETTQLLITTENPSNDDNVFFTYFVLSGTATLSEALVLTPSDALRQAGTTHTVLATLLDAQNDPIADRSVVFKVIAGPNEGQQSYPLATDAAGQASWSYTDTGEAGGTDQIEASFVNAQTQEQFSNTVTVTWSDELVPETQQLVLYPGWNLIFVSVDPPSSDPLYVFGPDSYLFTFHKSGTGFDLTYSYTQVSGPGTLTGATAYWLYDETPTAGEGASRTVEITGFRSPTTSTLLTKGWNLLGVHGNRHLPKSTAILAARRWDASLGEGDYVDAPLESGAFSLEPDYGYFIFATQPAQITISSQD